MKKLTDFENYIIKCISDRYPFGFDQIKYVYQLLNSFDDTILCANNCLKISMEIEYYAEQVFNNKKRPPIGIEPEFIWIERRCDELKLAIKRYIDNNIMIPNEWLNELSKLQNQLNGYKERNYK